MSPTPIEKITEKLFQLSPIEKRQKENGIHAQDFPTNTTSTTDGKVKLLDQFFFKNREIYVSKHDRFADYPLHSHQFFEMNYMFSGSCKQIIDGQEEVLKEGELLLMDAGSSHEIRACSENDILINMLFRDRNISIKWLNSVKKSRSLLFEFLLNSLTGVNNVRDYIIFPVGQISHIQHIMHQIISEYFLSKDYSGEIISLYLPILFTELVRNYGIKNSNLKDGYSHHENVISILRLIEQDHKEISLAKAAKKLGYNKNYLSNMVKEKTGLTFTQLVTKQRLNRARLLLDTTNQSISHIIQEVGFTNKTYFYKEYKKAYQELPSSSKERRD